MEGDARSGSRARAARALRWEPSTHPQVWRQAALTGLACSLACLVSGGSLGLVIGPGAALALFVGSIRSYRLSQYGSPHIGQPPVARHRGRPAPAAAPPRRRVEGTRLALPIAVYLDSSGTVWMTQDFSN